MTGGIVDLDKQTVTFVRANARDIVKLPEPGTVWMHKDLAESIKGKLHYLREQNVISHVEKVWVGASGQSRWKWQTDKEAYEYAQECVRRERENAPLPCGHNAIKNERGVEGISCGVC